MELKQVLHFYFNAQFMATPSGMIEPTEFQSRLLEIPLTGTEVKMKDVEDDNGDEFYAFVADIKPILRPLSSMTEEEASEYNKIKGALYHMADMQNQVIQEARATQFLLSRSFDLFNLIPEGKAIDATSLTQQQ